MDKLAVVALGGNALLRNDQSGTYNEQLDNIAATCSSLVELVGRGYNIVIGHGNGPQVGNVLLQHEAGRIQFGLPMMPMDFCVAETQGSIGYMIERVMHNALIDAQLPRNVLTLVTEVVVDCDDPRFKNPSKPIGPYYTKEQADIASVADGSLFREDPKGNGWRKVVASPMPLRIINAELVKRLATESNVVIAAGGGGIPVCCDGHGRMHGVEVVIDKDLALALMAIEIGADEFYILTDVPHVYLNFRKPGHVALKRITVSEAEEYIAAGQFSEGSMLPKIRAALRFVKNGGGQCVITEASQLGNPECGTHIVP